MKSLRKVRLSSALLLCFMVSPYAAGQALPKVAVPLDKVDSSAGIIFSGTVLQIEHAIASDAQPAYVQVKFRVEQAVRGCNAGDIVTLNEWAELWLRGDRYRKGQKLIIFLYSPSQTGFSSPVAGAVGTLNIGPQGLLPTTLQQAQNFASQATSSQPGVRAAHGNSDPKSYPRLRSNDNPQKFNRTEASE